MPNHCYNSLVVQTADRCEEARNQLKDYVKKSQILKDKHTELAEFVNYILCFDVGINL